MGMRLPAQAKMGFYPVKPETIAMLCRSLQVKDPKNTFILDPCCGQGRALGQIGDTLGIPRENRYGVELDAGRAELAAEHGNILHASFFGVRMVRVQSLSLVWLNPPYEDEIKQEPEQERKYLEVSFIEHAARYVDHHGIMVLHCPDDRMIDQVKNAFFSACYDCYQVELPGELRPWRESLLIGKKRPLKENLTFNVTFKRVTEIPPLVVPAGRALSTFIQVEPTDQEVIDSVSAARFMQLFNRKIKRAKMEPLLPLGPGHLGLTLASGMLDGYFAPQGWEPHVVRGVAYKENQKVSSDTTTDDNGKTTTTEVHRENIKLQIRALRSDGTIHVMR